MLIQVQLWFPTDADGFSWFPIDFSHDGDTFNGVDDRRPIVSGHKAHTWTSDPHLARDLADYVRNAGYRVRLRTKGGAA